jgi:hypothetical protein
MKHHPLRNLSRRQAVKRGVAAGIVALVSPLYGKIALAATTNRSRTLGIDDYDPSWPRLFETLRSRLLLTLGDVADSIEHVGCSAQQWRLQAFFSQRTRLRSMPPISTRTG